MAEGMIGGNLGDEDEEPDSEATETPAGADALAAALAAKIAASDPEVARESAAFLRDHSRLVNIQADHLNAEHTARLQYLQGQAREVDLRRLGLRLRVAFQVFNVVVATVIGAFLLVMLHDAFTSHRVVVEPFDTPRGLADKGLTGKVVASGVLDELTRLQDATRSVSAARGLTGAWASDVKLEVPQTGISISDVSRLLRERFGNDVHIDGDLVETPTGLALTVRGNNVPPKTFDGSLAELSKLTVAAAEYVYSKSQPSRWAAHLVQVESYGEAIAFCRTAVASAAPPERPRLLSAWALAIQANGGSAREALALLRAAVTLQSDLWVAHSNIMNTYMILGQEEEAWRAGETMRSAAGGRPGRAPENYYVNWDYLTWNLHPWLDATMADAEANAGLGTFSIKAGPVIADIQARRHDVDAAELAIKTTQEDLHDPTIAAAIHFVHGRLATEAGDTTRAATEMEAFGEAYADPDVSSNYPGYHCWIAPAVEATGQRDKADALLKTPGTFVDCYRFRADILDSRGDWAGAQKAYAEAVALAPDLPAAYYSWGVALLRRGDLGAAAEKLRDASQRGPHWADPLKAWGDVLMKQGQIQEALEKYDEALNYAPKWKQLQEARKSSAKQKS